MSDVIETYVCYVIFKKNEVGVLPRWASCPTLPYWISIPLPGLPSPVSALKVCELSYATHHFRPDLNLYLQKPSPSKIFVARAQRLILNDEFFLRAKMNSPVRIYCKPGPSTKRSFTAIHRRNTPSARVPLVTARSAGSIYLFAQFPTPARVLLSRGLSGGSSKPPTHCSRQAFEATFDKLQLIRTTLISKMIKTL